MLQESIKKLVQYGIDMGLTPECERIYTTNLLLECMKEDEYTDPDCDLSNIVLEDVLNELSEEKLTEFSKDNNIPVKSNKEKQIKLIVHEFLER